MKAKRGILIIFAAVLVLAAGLGALSLTNYVKNTREFVSDGYILKPSEEVNVTTEVNEQYYFGQGTRYKEKYASKILFKDKNGTKVSLDTEQYLHYADGSLGAFTKGVIMNLDDLAEDQFGYYSLTKNTILVKNGNSYEMSSRGEAMSLSEFIWKISDTDYMIVSPEVTLQLSQSTTVTLPDYAQIKYVDNGIVRIVHQQGTYQTVSTDTFLNTRGGAELNLVGKSFYVNGEPTVSLDSMAIDDDSYIELDENMDSPELEIPTFNVINGKDGTAGTDGEDGEEGEEGEKGEEGEEGTEGTEGSEGTAGAAGAMGSNGINGADGLDGLEGDSGVMGYDGANGTNGKDGLREDGTAGIVGVEVLARPMVTMDSSSFEITPGGVKMKLDMADSDNSLVQNSTEIKIYDRATMQEVSPPNNNWGLSLEQSGSFQIDSSNLSPDREYVLIVSGKYVSEESDMEGKEANLFTKVFKTDELGITLEKQSVTDASVTLRTLMSSTAIGSYDVVFYTYDDDGNKKMLAKYPGLTGSKSDLTFSVDSPGEENRDTVFAVESNTVYYASLANVTMLGNSALISADGTELKIRTLKKKPYKAGDEGTLISAMVPVLTANDKYRSLTVSMDALADPDNGIQGYRYELYKASEVTDAAANNTLSSLVPAYSSESDALKVQTFNLPAEDMEQYVARIVVLFDDNEKEVEYSTMFSGGVGLSSAAFPIVEFLQVNKTADLGGRHETLSGYIKIKDSSNALQKNISDSFPLLLTITSEYEDVYSLKLKETVTGPETDTDGAVYYYFEQSGLRKATPYALSVSGPVDTDGDGIISDAEKLTYLAGIRGTTTDTYSLRAVFTTENDATTAFKKRINITSGTEGGIPLDFYEYEAKTLGEIQLELVHITKDGLESVIGSPYIIKDSNAEAHASIFFDGGWVDQSAVTQDGSNGLTTDSPSKGSDDKLLLTPVSFGLDNNDSVFYSGGSFVIRVKEAVDYTANHRNIIPFMDGSNIIKFEIQKKHIQAADPTSQVSVGIISNENADTAYQEGKLDENTPVGLLIQANYPYTDALEITYEVYKLKDDETSPDTDASRNVYPAGTEATAIIDGGVAGLGELVCKTTLTELQGDLGAGRAEPVKLYFKDLGSAGTLTSSDQKWTNMSGESDLSKVMSRGGRYYVRYEVKASCDATNGMDCDNNGQPDKYPNCTYNVGEAVPYYRSKVTALEKQIPKVQRYPWTSGSDSMTWMYKIEDPDKAIVTTPDGTQAQIKVVPYDNIQAAAGTPSVLGITLADYQDSFKELTLSGLSSGKYYAVTMPYKCLTSAAAQQEITSMPVRFKALKNTAPSAIECKGKKADASVPDADKTGGYEKALTNQGGYRYRLTLRGEDVYNYAALRITFTGKDAGNNPLTVVYDPVYLEIQQGTMQDGTNMYPYAYAYLDTSALADMKRNISGKAVVKVEGYYSTNKTGVEGYSSAQDIGNSQKNLVDEKLYAMQLTEKSGKSKYVYLVNGGFVTTAGNADGSLSYLNRSLFIPGENTGAGFAATTLEGGETVDKGIMSQRYASVPLTLLNSDYTQSKTLNITYDENGMMDSAASVNAYFAAEELALGGEIRFGDDSNKVDLGDILPAVELIDFSQGVRSLLLNFEALGTGATESGKLYAEVLEQQGDGSYKSLKMSLQQEQRVNELGVTETINYYEADSDAANRYAADFGYNAYKDTTIPMHVKDGKIVLPLRIRGLNPDTRYHIVMFAYDSENNRKDLYSLDGKCISYNYEIKTKKSIDIDTSGPMYIYSAYEDKSAAFGFAVPGDEGTGMQAYYSVIERSSGNIVFEKTKLEPLGSGTRKYYSQKLDDNNKMIIPMKPSATGNALKLGTDYTIVVVVEDNLDKSELGKKMVDFRTPEELKAPDFYVQLSQEAEADMKAQITANIVCTDIQYTIVDNKYKVTVFEGENEVKAEDVTKSSNKDTKVQSITFDELKQDTLYTVVVSASVDRNNDGTGESKVEKTMTINTSAGASATLGANGTSDNLTLYLSNLKNFTNVGKLLMTAYKDGISCYNETREFTYSASQDSYEMNFSWGTKEAGSYEIQVQYQTSDGKMLGNDSITLKVSGGLFSSVLNQNKQLEQELTEEELLKKQNALQTDKKAPLTGTEGQSGAAQNGTIQGGTTGTGAAQAGTTQSGTTGTGAAQAGTTQSGTTGTGVTPEGTVQGGDPSNGTPQDGTKQDGAAPDSQNGSGEQPGAESQKGGSLSGDEGQQQNSDSKNGADQKGADQSGAPAEETALSD